MDVLDFFTGEQGWTIFYAYLGELPSSSKFNSAVSQDPEIAKAQVNSLTDEQIQEIMEKEKSDEEEELHLSPEGYTLEIEKLNQVIEEIKLLRLGMTGDKKQKFVPPKRPKTEKDILLNKRKEALEERDRDEMQKSMGF